MSRLAAFLVASTLCLAARATDGGAPDQPKFPACIGVRAAAPYTGAGYDHVVTLENGCEKPAACSVSTDVSPDSIDVSLRPGESRDVVTFRGSPASTFQARVRCRLED